MQHQRFRLIEMSRTPIITGCLNHPVIVGFSGAMHSGKSTAAKFLQGDLVSRIEKHAMLDAEGADFINSLDAGVYQAPFAGFLKCMLLSLGLTHDDVYGSKKDVPNALLCGKTPRHAMQTLGTEWRDMIGRDLWLNLWARRVEELRAHPYNTVLVDDVRFKHEIKAVRDMGGIVIKIERDDLEVKSQHASEQKIPDMFFDAIVKNNFGVHQLYKNVNQAIEALTDYHEADKNA